MDGRLTGPEPAPSRLSAHGVKSGQGPAVGALRMTAPGADRSAGRADAPAARFAA